MFADCELTDGKVNFLMPGKGSLDLIEYQIDCLACHSLLVSFFPEAQNHRIAFP